MTATTSAKALLSYVPITIPTCAICGVFAGALGGGSIALLAEPGLLSHSISIALIAGVPVGLLFWAMKDKSGKMRSACAVILIVVCFWAFLLFFTPTLGIASL